MTKPWPPTDEDRQQRRVWNLLFNIQLRHRTGLVNLSNPHGAELGNPTAWTYHHTSVGGTIGASTTREHILRATMVGYYDLTGFTAPEQRRPLHAAGLLLQGDPCHTDPVLSQVWEPATATVRGHLVNSLDLTLTTEESRVVTQILDHAAAHAHTHPLPVEPCSPWPSTGADTYPFTDA